MNLDEKVNITFRQLVDEIGDGGKGSISDRIYNLHLRNECNKKQKNIYLCTEQTMNGTVTTQISIILIEASSFKEAVNKLKIKINALPVTSINMADNEISFQYIINNELFAVYGSIENKIANFLKE